MIVGIGQRDEGIGLVETGLVHAPHGPLAGPFEATADALPTREIEGSDGVEASPLDEDHGTVQALIGRDRMEARHSAASIRAASRPSWER